MCTKTKTFKGTSSSLLGHRRLIETVRVSQKCNKINDLFHSYPLNTGYLGYFGYFRCIAQLSLVFGCVIFIYSETGKQKW